MTNQEITMHELMRLLPPKDYARIDRVDKYGRIILKHAGNYERIRVLLEHAGVCAAYGSVTDAVPFRA
jgi:hypothetical protein